MAVLNRIRVSWTGFPGAPGLSTFYNVSGTAPVPVAAIRQFFQDLNAFLRSNTTITVHADGDDIDDADGTLSGSWAHTPAPAAVTGSASTGVYAAPAGAVVNWVTGGIVNGRRLRGKTFIVPLATGAFDSDGSLGAFRTTLLTAANTLLTSAPGLAVWHRPSAPGAVDGSSALITSASVPDLVAVLRSRRD